METHPGPGIQGLIPRREHRSCRVKNAAESEAKVTQEGGVRHELEEGVKGIRRGLGGGGDSSSSNGCQPWKVTDAGC